MSQLKIKNGNNWESIPAGGIGVPSGGSSGQYLKKSSSTDYATEWAGLDIASVSRTAITPTVTKTSGNCVFDNESIKAFRYGNIVELHLKVKNSSGSSIAVGTNAIQGTVSDIPLPPDYISSCGYNSSTCLVGTLASDGTYIARVTGGQFVNNGEVVHSFTYIV